MSFRISEPAVSRKNMVISAGITWLIGAAVLLGRSIELLQHDLSNYFWPVVIGMLFGVFKYQMVLAKVVSRNVKRIRELSPHKKKICFFAFQPLQSYFLLILMVGAGITLRMVGLKQEYLLGIYLAISTALILSAILFLRQAKSISSQS